MTADRWGAILCKFYWVETTQSANSNLQENTLKLIGCNHFAQKHLAIIIYGNLASMAMACYYWFTTLANNKYWNRSYSNNVLAKFIGMKPKTTKHCHLCSYTIWSQYSNSENISTQLYFSIFKVVTFLSKQENMLSCDSVSIKKVYLTGFVESS